MAVRQISNKYYVSFKWKGHRIETVTSASTAAEAKRIEKSVKTAFRINRYDHLEPLALEVVTRTYENKGWALPTDLAPSVPEERITLIGAVKEYLRADERHRAERNLYAIDRLVEQFGERLPLGDLKVAQIKQYQKTRQKQVANATVNRELAVLSGILRFQLELGNVEHNPCLLTKRLPANQRDSYLSWEDFQRVLEHSWWLHDVLVILYYTGMRFSEVVNLRWEMFKPERRMIVLPPSVTKEGKNPNKARLKPKRVPLRREAFELLESLRKPDGENVVNAMGLVFGYAGRYKDSDRSYLGKPIDRTMVRNAG